MAKGRKEEERMEPVLPAERAIQLFKSQMAKIDDLSRHGSDDPEVSKWDNFTEQLIVKAFGSPHSNLHAFQDSRYAGSMYVGMPDEEIQENHIRSLQQRKW